MKQKLKLFTAFLCGAVLFSGVTYAQNNDLIAKVVNLKVKVDGKEKKFKNNIVKINNNIYVPLSDVTGATGYNAKTTSTVIEINKVETITTPLSSDKQVFNKQPAELYKYVKVLSKNGELYEIDGFDADWIFTNQQGKQYIALEHLNYIKTLFFIINDSYDITESTNPYLNGRLVTKIDMKLGVHGVIDYDNLKYYSKDGDLVYSYNNNYYGVNKKYTDAVIYNVKNKKMFNASSNPNKMLNVIEFQSFDKLHLISLEDIFGALGVSATIDINKKEEVVTLYFK